MKRYCWSIAIRGLIILFLPMFAYAQQRSEDTQLARLSPAMLGSVPAGGGTENIGQTVDPDASVNGFGQWGIYMAVTTVHAGTISTMYYHPYSTATGTFYAAVYNASKALIQASSGKVNLTADWNAFTFSTPASVGAGVTVYLFIGVPTGGGHDVGYTGGTGTWYGEEYAGESTPPATLAASPGYTNTDGPLCVYAVVDY